MATVKVTEAMIDDLYDVIASLKSKKDCKLLFEDLCTYKEVEQMAQRVKAAKLLMEGKTYAQIIEEIDISSTTLSRVSRCIQYGKGYTKFIKVEEGDSK